MTGVHVRVRVGRERYALPIESVREVAALGGLSAVPGASDAVRGVRNFHGRVLPVFDLGKVLSISRSGESTSRVVVLEHQGREAGLEVDEVTDVNTLAGTSETVDAEHLQGAVLEDGQLVGIVDVGRLFEVLEAKAT
jgi:chemotaxis signal transduction protein